jgi:hypothetical protein
LKGSPPAIEVDGGHANASIEIGDEGVVPESDNGDANESFASPLSDSNDSEEDNEDDGEEVASDDNNNER